MTVTTRPEVPRALSVEELLGVDAEQALIEEARRRARRRRMRYASAALVAGLVGLAVFTFGDRAQLARPAGARAAPSAPASIRRLPARANGVLAIEDRKSLDVVKPDDSGLRALTRCPATPGGCMFGSYTWSPDGKRLAFLSGDMGGAFTHSNLSLFVVNSDGTGRRRLARCSYCDPRPSWSPDSRRIVMGTAANIDIVNVVTGAQRRLGVSGLDPVWSPTGTTIAFGLGSGLYSINPDGSGMAEIAAAEGQVADPAWSPDGTSIAFDTPDDIYVIDADGSHLKLLLAGAPASGPAYPTWSPRGDRILYLDTPMSASGYAAEVWVMNPDGSHRRRLYRSSSSGGAWGPPIWSPDGKAIAVGMGTSTANGIAKKGILVMDAHGNHRRRVFGAPTAIAWQPIPLAP